ncbi:hypothetical protein C0J52_22009, partial [Blattella germanica]
CYIVLRDGIGRPENLRLNASLVLSHFFLCLLYALKMNMRLRNEYLAIALFNEITTTLFVRIPLASYSEHQSPFPAFAWSTHRRTGKPLF